MKAMISEAGILEIKALVMSKSVFNQLREVRQKELERSNPIEHHTIGYVNDPLNLGCTWLVAQEGETIIRVRESEYWWIFRRSMPHANTEEIGKALQDKIHSYQQIFIK